VSVRDEEEWCDNCQNGVGKTPRGSIALALTIPAQTHADRPSAQLRQATSDHEPRRAEGRKTGSEREGDGEAVGESDDAVGSQRERRGGSERKETMAEATTTTRRRDGKELDARDR
jgi:hypothetical protein